MKGSVVSVFPPVLRKNNGRKCSLLLPSSDKILLN